MKHSLFIGLILALTAQANAQIAHDIILGAHADLMKTDHDELLRKAQFGMEGNYFITREFTATAGFDIWTADEISFIIGARWFPVEEAFVRARGYISSLKLSVIFIFLSISLCGLALSM
jgi:hypothetical protein